MTLFKNKYAQTIAKNSKRGGKILSFGMVNVNLFFGEQFIPENHTKKLNVPSKP